MSTAAKPFVKTPTLFSIGLMSGTSMDGIDAALLRTSGTADCIEDLGHYSLKYPVPFKILLKAAEFAMRKHQGHFPLVKNFYGEEVLNYLNAEYRIQNDELKESYQHLLLWLDKQSPADTHISLSKIIELSTDYHELAVRKLLSVTGFHLDQIDVIGYHGQSLFHQPQRKISINIGDAYRLSQSLGVKVVNDFRSRDIQAGGQGAPFAPLYHYALAMRDQKFPLAVVNCGGIANISLIPSAAESDIQAFDTGPGNGLIDLIVRQRTQGRELMDEQGKYGLQGCVHEEIFERMYVGCILKDGKNYFTLPPPKSLDIGDMILIPELNSLSLEDACATLEAFTADSIVSSLGWAKQEIPHHWVLCGGGWNNPVIVRELKQRLRNLLGTDACIQTAEAAGWSSQGMEAQIFAYLAVRCLRNLPLSLPGTTGVPQPLSGGQIHIPTLSILKTIGFSVF